MGNIDVAKTGKPMIHLGQGDPSVYPCFRTSPIVGDALVEAIRSANFNCYGTGARIDPAKGYLTFFNFIFWIYLFFDVSRFFFF